MVKVIQQEEATEIFLNVLKQNPERTLENLNDRLLGENFKVVLHLLRDKEETVLPFCKED